MRIVVRAEPSPRCFGVHAARQPGPRQTGDGQILQVDRLVIADQPESELVVCVKSSLPHLAVQDGNPTGGLASIRRGALLARQSPLRDVINKVAAPSPARGRGLG